MSQQLWGADVRLDAPTTLTQNVHLSSVVLVPESGVSTNSFADVAYLLHAEQDKTKVVLASLAPSRPNALLTHEASNGVKLSVTVVGAQAASASGYHISVSGYTTNGASASSAASSAPAATTQAQKRKPEEPKPNQQQQQKKQKVAQEQKQVEVEDEDEEEEEEEEAAPVNHKPATPSKPAAATKSATASPASAATTPSKPVKNPIVTLKNGVKLQEGKLGTGKEAVDRSAVSIRYRGSLASNGKVFDTNMPRGQPLRFKIGGGDVIAGFEQGTKGMKVGGTRTVVIPPQFGYGARGAPPDIPPNATLVFDLELVSVK